MRYTMHDLVHDLARSAIHDELIVIDGMKGKTSERKYCRYAVLTNYNGKTKLSNILPKKVRALHLSSSSKLGPGDYGSFSFAKRLRILDFSECSGILLSSSIGQLQRLKCLTAPKLQNESLPEAIAQLLKLQFLNLRGSSRLSALPESIGKLNCLIYLGLSGCSRILKVPETLGYCPTVPETYSVEGGAEFMFPVLDDLEIYECPRLRLKPCPPVFHRFCHIDGSDQVISSLEDMGNNSGHLTCSTPSAKLTITRSNCKTLRIFHHFGTLQQLSINDCLDLTVLPESMRHLASLLRCCCCISCEGVSVLPEWMGELSSLKELHIVRCRRIKCLPSTIHQLTELRMLNICYKPELKRWCESEDNKQKLAHIGDKFYKGCD